jgi:aspartate/methionine/tyrosine aminotransferase
MTFSRNDYLDWYIPRMRLGDAINLHASGVESLGGEFAADLSGNPWESVGGFEAALGQWLGQPGEELVFTPGATGGTLLALLTLGRNGSTVLAESPIYEPMWRQAERLNPIQRFQRRPEDGWQLPLNELHERLHPNVSVVMITEPHNPSGVLAPREQVLELAKMAQDVGAYVLINEVYRGYSQTPSYHCEADNIVVVSSLSKFIGAYWMRLGWLSATAELCARLRQGHLNMGLGTLVASMAGMRLLDSIEPMADAARERSNAGREIVHKWVEATPDVTWSRPQGPAFGAISIPAQIDDLAFAEHLHEKCGVLVVPGHCFDIPATLRISWLQAGDRLQEGLDILGSEIASF